MRCIPLLLVGLTVTSALIGCRDEPAQTAEPDGPTVAEVALHNPEHARVHFENDYVLVAEFTVPADGTIAAHYGRNRAVYALSDYQLQFSQKGTESIQTAKAGELSWHPAGVHSVRNVGGAPARFLVVYRKLSRLFTYSLTDDAEDVTCLVPAASEILLENTTMRVSRFTLTPGSSLPRHRGLNRVMCALDRYELLYVTDSGESRYSCQVGDVHYFSAESHAVKNIGTTVAKYLMFELKE